MLSARCCWRLPFARRLRRDGRRGDERGRARPSRRAPRSGSRSARRASPRRCILGELWRQALAVNGYTVDLRKSIGPAEDLDQALRDGEIDGHVAYTGTVLSIVAGEDVTGLDPEETYDRVKAFYAGRGHGDERDDAVRERRRDRHHERVRAARTGCGTIGDLRRLDGFTLGARPEFESLSWASRGCRRSTASPTRSSSRSRSAPSTRRSTRATSTRPTCSPPTRAGGRGLRAARGPREAVRLPERRHGGRRRQAGAHRPRQLPARGRRGQRAADDHAIVEMNAAVSDGQDEADVARRFLRDAGLLEPLGSDGGRRRLDAQSVRGSQRLLQRVGRDAPGRQKRLRPGQSGAPRRTRATALSTPATNIYASRRRHRGPRRGGRRGARRHRHHILGRRADRVRRAAGRSWATPTTTASTSASGRTERSGAP